MPDGPLPSDTLEAFCQRLSRCRLCVDAPDGSALPHQPRPIFQVSQRARLAICSQAPGTRAHASGRPFDDPSGERLRAWMDITSQEFYDPDKVVIVPMGFCFPGQDAKGGDRPPRRECARTWRQPLFERLPQVQTVLAVGLYAQKWHLGERAEPTLTGTVRRWRAYAYANNGPQVFPLPHPSWRNNAWLKQNPWFAQEVLPALRRAVRAAIDTPT